MTIPKTLWLTPLGDNSVENWGSIPAAGIMQITSPRHNESISKKNNIRWHGAQGSVNKNTKTPQGTGSTRRTGINVFANDAGSCHLKWHTTSVASPASSHVRFFFFFRLELTASFGTAVAAINLGPANPNLAYVACRWRLTQM